MLLSVVVLGLAAAGWIAVAPYPIRIPTAPDAEVLPIVAAYDGNTQDNAAPGQAVLDGAATVQYETDSNFSRSWSVWRGSWFHCPDTSFWAVTLRPLASDHFDETSTLYP